MAETKRKSRGEAKGKRGKPSKKQKKGTDTRERKGPRLPNALRKELERLNPVDEGFGSDEDQEEVYGRDLYEYEEELPEEESKKNRRYDPVENLEYQMPEEFEDENVSSDDDNDTRNAGEDGVEDEDEKDDDGRQRTTRITSEAFEGKKKKKNNVVISEAYPESEYNPTRDMLEGEGPVSIGDLLDPLHGVSGYSKLRKRIHHLEKKSVPTPAPLPKADQEKLERKAAYEKSKEELQKWEPIIKRNREAPTIYFDDDMDLGFSTVGAIASEFEPRTEFEKKIASLVYDDQVMEAHQKDGSRLLELNKVSAEDEKDRHNRMAKMRSLLFRHEMKSKHIKKIKSKTYHRLLKKDRLKASSTQSQMDPEAAKELAMKQEYERAKERMTLRHKGSSKWTKRIKERGIDVQDEGTRTAIAERQHLHALLTRKMNSMKDGSSSSSDDTSDEDVYSAGSDQARASKLLEKAKEKTLNLLDEDDEVPKSGVLSLPFMVRGLKKRNEAAAEEAKLALQEYESWSNQLEDSNGADNAKVAPPSGRMVFNASKKEAPESSNKTQSDDKIRSDNYYGNSDSEDDFEPKENVDIREDRSSDLQNNGGINPVLLHKESKNHKDSLFKNFDDIVQDPGPKTTHEVSIFASGTWKKMKGGNNADANANKPTRPVESVVLNQNFQDLDEYSDADSEGQMVDGILTSKNAGDEGQSSNNLSVTTNVIYLYRYAENLSSQQKIEITKVEQTKKSSGNAKEIPAGGDGFSGKGVKEDVLLKKDYLISAMKAVCDKLEQANGKVLVSDIKKDLGYSGTRPGNRAWRKICGKLEAADIVKKFEVQVNKKVEQFLGLLKKFCPVSFDPKNPGQVKFIKKCQTTDLLVELPIEHQIQELINAAGSEGIIMSNVSKRLGIGRKESDKLIESMCSRFGMIKKKERNKKNPRISSLGTGEMQF